MKIVKSVKREVYLITSVVKFILPMIFFSTGKFVNPSDVALSWQLLLIAGTLKFDFFIAVHAGVFDINFHLKLMDCYGVMLHLM